MQVHYIQRGELCLSSHVLQREKSLQNQSRLWLKQTPSSQTLLQPDISDCTKICYNQDHCASMAFVQGLPKSHSDSSWPESYQEIVTGPQQMGKHGTGLLQNCILIHRCRLMHHRVFLVRSSVRETNTLISVQRIKPKQLFTLKRSSQSRAATSEFC